MPHLLIKDLPRYECLIEAAKHYPELDPSACEVFLHLLRAGDEAFMHAEQNLTEHNISHGRFSVLMLLAQGCPAGESGEASLGRTPAELADSARVTRATMTGLIDTLERDGFVRREADTQDRRMMRICLTPKARKFLGALLPSHFSRMAAVMSGLDERERRMLVNLLNKIYVRAADLNTEAGSARALSA